MKRLRIREVSVGEREIAAALTSLGPLQAPALMVHSSLSACGHVDGGARTVVDALQSWVGAATLAMPTHSYCYPADGQPAPTFDPECTPSLVGTITNHFWSRPGVLRSLHPSHSLACSGPLAAQLCEGHEWRRTPCGRGTPYERLVDLDCAVLLFGATLDGYTFFHTAEEAAGCPYLYFPQPFELAYQDICGIRWSVSSLRHDMGVPRRFAAMDAWLEQRELLRRCRLGHGELLFIPRAGCAHRALVDAMRGNPRLLVADQ